MYTLFNATRSTSLEQLYTFVALTGLSGGPEGTSDITQIFHKKIYLIFQEEAANEIQSKQKKELERLKLMDLSQYSIKGQEAEWSQALKSGKTKSMVSIPR